MVHKFNLGRVQCMKAQRQRNSLSSACRSVSFSSGVEQVAALFVDGGGFYDGAMYDPSDPTSMRVDRDGAGGAPAADDVVGFLMDKRQMGGQTAADFIAGLTELVTDGGFDVGTVPAGWYEPRANSTISIVSGRLNTQADDSAVFGAALTLSGLTVGEWYRVVYSCDPQTSPQVTVRVDDASSLGNTPAEVVHTTEVVGAELFFQAIATSMYFGGVTAGDASYNFSFDDVSVKHVPGNHAVAISDAARPILRENSGVYSLDHDGVNDGLFITPWTPPASLEMFAAVKTVDTHGVFGNDTDATKYFGAFEDGSVVAMEAGSGSPSYYVDGTIISPVTRNGLHDTMSDGSWHVVNARALEISSWSRFEIFHYTAITAYKLDGDLGPIVLIESAALDAAARATIKSWIDEEVGL